ncbi:hypothetical protein [Gimesia algae]|uniref:Uncharacterized protein n=1 Tax=Gimesia algae TaxID=2527971 RepID=A0A517VMD3_9PLAN|nr:hypothetical protein [Gimesia algae]QDT94179.1 hypothetical protein Pan161_58720 [Gimesia algae]
MSNKRAAAMAAAYLGYGAEDLDAFSDEVKRKVNRPSLQESIDRFEQAKARATEGRRNDLPGQRVLFEI